MLGVLSDFDAVLIVGDNPFISYLYSAGSPIPDHCRLFQITNDGSSAALAHSTELACIGSLKPSLQYLLTILLDDTKERQEALTNIFSSSLTERQTRLVSLVERLADELGKVPITPFAATGAVLNALHKDVIIVDEAPATMSHVRDFVRTASFQRYFFMRSAILGWGLPASVGVALGSPGYPVLALLGDGSALYTPQGLWTAARQRLPITFVVMNNSEYNILKRYSVAQGYEKGGCSTIAGMELTDPSIDFPALANAFGLEARRITHAHEIESAIKEGLRSGRPNLIEIIIGTS